MRILGMLFAILCIGFIGGSTGGCTSYRYILVSPAEFQTVIKTDADDIVKLDPLEYRLRVRDNRLVMTIVNPTSDTIELLGAQSAVTDPTGRARSVPSQAIPAGAFMRLVFPPLRQQQPQNSSRMRMGVGVNVRVDADPPNQSSEPFWPESVSEPVHAPRCMIMTDNGFWEWRGEGSIRVMLVYQRGAGESRQEFQQEFTFARQKR